MTDCLFDMGAQLRRLPTCVAGSAVCLPRRNLSDMQPGSISTYNPQTYLREFLPEPAALQHLLTPEAERFFIMPVEQMYPLFTRPLPPGRSTSHNLLYVRTGTARMHIGPETYTIGPNEVLLVRAGQVYSFGPGDVNTGYICHFHDDLLLGGRGGGAEALGSFEFLRFWGQPVIQLGQEIGGFAEQLLHRLVVEYDTQQLRYPEVIRAYLLALLHELGRAYATAEPAEAGAAAKLTGRFKQLLAASVTTTHRVSDYAEQLHITPDHLSKCVRRVTGKSPARWIEESIVLEAKVLLAQTTWPVSEVALAVGIADASYFSRLFRKHTGLAPLAFRKQQDLS